MLLDRFNKMGRRRDALAAMNHDTRGWPLRTKAGLVTFTVTSFFADLHLGLFADIAGHPARAMLQTQGRREGAGSDHPFTHFAASLGR